MKKISTSVNYYQENLEKRNVLKEKKREKTSRAIYYWTQTSTALTFLLIDSFDSDVLPLFPVDLIPCVAGCFWPIGEQGLRIIQLWQHSVHFCQNFTEKYSFDLKTNSVGKLSLALPGLDLHQFMFSGMQPSLWVSPAPRVWCPLPGSCPPRTFLPRQGGSLSLILGLLRAATYQRPLQDTVIIKDMV